MEEFKNIDIKNLNTKELEKMRDNLEKSLLKSQKAYKKMVYVTNSMGILAFAGLSTFAVAFNPILKISGLFFAFCSSCVGCYCMGSKKYAYLKAECQNATNINIEITEELNKRYWEDTFEDDYEDTI